MKINYQKVAKLPPLIRSFCHQGNGWIVGSGAKYLLDLKEDYPNDWDIIIPHTHWKTTSKSVPAGTISNSHGGFKILEINNSIEYKFDLWTQDVADFLAETPNPPEYAVIPKFMRFLTCSNEWLRIKSG